MTKSIKPFQGFGKLKNSLGGFTGGQLKVHIVPLPNLIMVLLVTTCMIHAITTLVPRELSKAFAKGQQDKSNQSSDEKCKTSSSADNSASSKDPVTIRLTSVEFAPLTYSENNHLIIIVNYKTNDPVPIYSPMAATMKVYDFENNVIKTSKITNGYVLGQSGPM